jgi:hypothetical protein
MSLTSSRSPYTAEIFGSSWAQGPVQQFLTITAARQWAEEYGSTADWCRISDAKGRLVAGHRRAPNGGGWFRVAAG